MFEILTVRVKLKSVKCAKSPTYGAAVCRLPTMDDRCISEIRAVKQSVERKSEEEKSEKPLEKLPGPDFGSSSTSVFSNPFIEAENAKKAILEKHVKMVPTRQDTRVINGKKICWNYRKGRCRFGHKCAFAHDSDLQKSAEELQEENQLQPTVICQTVNQNNLKSIPDPSEYDSNSQTDRNVNNSKKKRPGLSQGLVPGKKVMKMFHKQDKQTSWSSKPSKR